MDLVNPNLLLFGTLSAATLHELFLRRVEIDHLAVPVITASSAVQCALIYYTGFVSACVLAAHFWLPLWLYIGAYRAFFHPLHKYPGPFSAKLSRWWMIRQCVKTEMHVHRVHQELQKEYGDYVRTGPRELTIYDTQAVAAILGSKSKTTKGPFYDMLNESLHMNRDKQWHRQRRRVWDNAFKASLSDYAPSIEKFTDQLLARLRALKGEPVSLLDSMMHYSYDVVSDMAFGKSMGFITGESSETAEEIVGTMTKGMFVLGLIQHMPWAMKVLDVIATRYGPMKDWTDYSEQHMKVRIAKTDAKPDLVSHLINNTPKDEAGRQLLYGDSRLIISAGAETTSTALTILFIHLATRPEYVRALRKEMHDNAATYNCQRPLPLLDALIQESMRMWPSVISPTQRITPPEGINIGERFIPGNMMVMIPPFPLFRDPRNFVRPDEFIPERWLDKPELVINRDAFFPFSTGPYNCAGKALAMMELRSVFSGVITEFDVVLPEDFDDKAYWDAMTDQFTVGPPKQDVRFVKLEK